MALSARKETMSCTRRACGALLLVLLAPTMLPAQSGTASLRGVVTDPSASVVPNVAITVSNGEGNSKSVQSDAQGRYQLNGLPPGSVTIRAAAPGFTPFEQVAYKLVPGQTQNLD